MKAEKRRIILASGSQIRAKMLRDAGLVIEVIQPCIDEERIRTALRDKNTNPKDMAGELAAAKARKLSQEQPGTLVIGSDQILEFDHEVFCKPKSPDDARAQLTAMRGKSHRLLSAAVVCENGQLRWRHVGEARLTMRDFSAEYLERYVQRNWLEIRHTVGCYQLEKEGVRLFSCIEGDYFNVLGLPLIELLTWTSKVITSMSLVYRL